ncbi:hypothetical protein O4H61_11610 [Roseovarius aestuarii]|nr:hypothetical protein [Roseovarius aestuarii]
MYDARTSPNAGPIWWSAHVDGAGQGDQADAARQGRVRTAQMLRALRELVDMGGDGRANAARLSHAITGEVLDMDAPGGDDARIIECVAKE